MTAEDQDSLREAFRGCVLGSAIGDAIAQPFKGWSPARIDREPGDLARQLGRSPARYSEDTALTIVAAEWLLEEPALDLRSLAVRIAETYDTDRGYGRTTTEFLRRLHDGESWETASSHCFPRGSFGNGAAARVGPLALWFRADRTAMDRAVETAAALTHCHPLGVAGAIQQARQIVIALEHRGAPFDPIAIAVELRSTTGSQEYRQKLRAVEECLAKPVGNKLVRDRLGCNATALGSVPTALFCFLSHPESFQDAIVAAVALGGETDSIASMTGAIAGVYHGAKGIPDRWLGRLEDGAKGRSYIERTADRLLERCSTMSSRSP